MKGANNIISYQGNTNKNLQNGENPKKLTILIVWQDLKKPEFLSFAIGGVKWQSHLGRNSVSYKFKCLLFDPAITILHMYPREKKIYIHKRFVHILIRCIHRG